MGALGSSGGGGSYAQDTSSHVNLGPVTFGDKNIGSGLKLPKSPLALGIIAVAAVLIVFIFKKFA